jgi:hypothetical protein
MKPVSDFTYYWFAAHQFVNAANPYVPEPAQRRCRSLGLLTCISLKTEFSQH